MISRIDAQKLVDNSILVLNTEELHICNALGYVLAEDVFSLIDLPPFNKSAMDGYAVCDNDNSKVLDVVGVVRAGSLPDVSVAIGKAVKIMTGAPVPEGTGKIVIKENVTCLENNRIQILIDSKAKNICFQGEDINKGQLIYKAGTYITEIVLANIVSSGISKIEVYRKPSVAVVTTGDELLAPGEKYCAGKIYNSNGILLKSLLGKYGIEIVNIKNITDDKKAMRDGVSKILEEADLVVLTGGISVGDYDFTKEILEDLGAEIIFHKIAMKPGKPVGFFKLGNKGIFALPGNPVSVYVSFFQFVLPAVYKMQGMSELRRVKKIRLSKNINVKKSDREVLLPVILTDNNDIILSEYHGSGHLYALSTCNAFLVVPIGTDVLEAGLEVELGLIRGCE
jgi:molybdopterin molybdotransferase